MIDWIRFRVACTHIPNELASGHVVSLKNDGEIEWHTAKRLIVEGSYSKTITIRSYTDNTIEIEGNPAKFLQGHNVFGSNDLQHLALKTFDRLCMHDELKLTPTDQEYYAIEDGQYYVGRVDVNEHFSVPSAAQAKAFIRAISNSANMRHRGPGIFKGDTLYFSPASKRSVGKIYHKGDEILSSDPKHRLPDELLQIPELVEYAQNSVRLELKILSTQLKEWELHRGCNWTPETPTILLNEQFIEKLQLSPNMAVDYDLVKQMPSKVRLTYTGWVNGEDLRAVLSPATFKRHRKELLNFGIDIAVVQTKEKKDTNIIPMIRYLEAIPMGIPDWAYQKGLVA